MAELEQIAAGIMPPSMAIDWTDLAFLQRQAGNTAMYAFLLAVVFVFLVLAGQYESWGLPLAVILVVPMCLLSSLIGVRIAGMEVNCSLRLVSSYWLAWASKNAILIVQFAKRRQEEGLPRFETAIEAARLRLRPILMTSLAFILGVMPLVLAEGAGRRDASRARRGGLQRHDRRDAVRPHPDADLLFCVCGT